MAAWGGGAQGGGGSGPPGARRQAKRLPEPLDGRGGGRVRRRQGRGARFRCSSHYASSFIRSGQGPAECVYSGTVFRVGVRLKQGRVRESKE